MKFGEAFDHVEEGKSIRRAGWNGAGQFVWLQTFPGYEPVFVIRNAQGKHQPGWLPSMGDLRADDWETCEPSVIG